MTRSISMMKMCQLHAVTQWGECSHDMWSLVYKVNMIYVFTFILDVPESPKIAPSTGPYTTRKFTYTYHDDNRWAVSVGWSIHFKQTRIENDYRTRYDMSNQHHDPVPKHEWSRKRSLPQVSHCNIWKKLAEKTLRLYPRWWKPSCGRYCKEVQEMRGIYPQKMMKSWSRVRWSILKRSRSLTQLYRDYKGSSY